ncbi:ABC transporter substrate-binding protein [Acuticoccus sp.]|uniref:ABC transporter substrate-binding protein n=1 Tax=Acuticoccus sp. TaxID=1904378 RepID=UPI003B52245D
MRLMRGSALGLTAVALALAAHSAEAGKADDTLVWTTDREVAVIDPYYNNTRELVIMGHLGWDAVLFYNLDTEEYEPLLATEWTYVDDTTMDLTLREDVVFHDGSSFGPEDLAYTINHVTREDAGVLTAQNVEWLESAEVTGENTVRIHLDEPFPAAEAYLAGAIFAVPEGHYDDAPMGPDGKPDFAAVDPVGTGPYKWVETVPGERVEWAANEDYFEGGPKGQPEIANITFRTLKDPNTQMAELMTGGVDWIWDVPKEQAERLEQSGQVTVENAKTMRISYLHLDATGTSNTEALTDKRVRQAIAHAIDRESIARNLVGPASVVIHSACHPDQFGCTDDVAQYSYDPDKARQLLEEAGYGDGLELDIYAYRQREFTEAVIGDLRRVGIDANLNFLQYAALRDLVWGGETPIAHMTWGSSSIPDVSASLGHFFEGGRDDPAKDDAVIAAVKRGDTSIEPEAREAAYKDALSIIAEEAYWVPMFTYAKYYAYSNDLNFEATADEIPRFYKASWK